MFWSSVPCIRSLKSAGQFIVNFVVGLMVATDMSFTFAVKWSFTQLAVEGLTVVLTFVFSSFFQVQTVVQIVGISKPQIIEDFVQAQTMSVFQSASSNKASTLQCLRSRSHCRNVPVLSSGAHLGEHR